MSPIIKEIKEQTAAISNKAEVLRPFGIILGLLLLLGWLLGDWRQMVFIFLGALIFSAALFAPGIIRPIYATMMKIAILLGNIFSRITLLFLYYVIFLFVRVLLFIFSKDILKIKFNKNLNSYFEKTPRDSDYKKMF